MKNILSILFPWRKQVADLQSINMQLCADVDALHGRLRSEVDALQKRLELVPMEKAELLDRLSALNSQEQAIQSALEKEQQAHQATVGAKAELESHLHKAAEEAKHAKLQLHFCEESLRVSEASHLSFNKALMALREEFTKIKPIPQSQKNDIEACELRRLLEEERNSHSKTKRGTGVLMQFIHRTHRLNVPFDEGSIRAAINDGIKASGMAVNGASKTK